MSAKHPPRDRNFSPSEPLAEQVLTHAQSGRERRRDHKPAQRGGDLPGDSDSKALASFVIDAWEGAVLRAKIEKNRAPLESFIAMVFCENSTA